MAIATRWDDQSQTRLLVEFETTWTWDDLESAIQEVDTHIASVSQQVDIIIDVEGSQLPKDFMNAAKKLLTNPESRGNEGRRIVVGANGMVRAAYGTLQKTFGDRLNGRDIVFAQNLSQARSMLYSMRLNDQA